MKKRLYFITTMLVAAAALSLSSCLKDSRYVTFAEGGTVVNFPLGGVGNFGKDAITEAPADDADGTIVREFAVAVSSPTVPTTATAIKLAVDNSIVDAYNALGGPVTYLPMPADAYTFTNTDVTVPAGQRSATISVTFKKNKLDPTLSYMLPIKIVSATGGGTISGNFGIHYYHFIGNDFAGAYLRDYTRIPASGNFVGNDGVIYPVTPTQFEMYTGYYTGTVRFEVTFTKNGTGAGATYTNWAVDLNPDDVANILTPNGIAVNKHPVFVNIIPGKAYTYDEVVHGLLKFNWTTVSGRDITDYYYKP